MPRPSRAQAWSRCSEAASSIWRRHGDCVDGRRCNPARTTPT
jgi:hypothetical protein